MGKRLCRVRMTTRGETVVASAVLEENDSGKTTESGLYWMVSLGGGRRRPIGLMQTTDFGSIEEGDMILFCL
ncbi:unnamed protein product [Linum trigynum]|uniref:Uncharacterized protein n=1 Tax=Linum trigynum TaxID=586398 RepID=A0AAV2GDF1_9ROSI